MTSGRGSGGRHRPTASTVSSQPRVCFFAPNLGPFDRLAEVIAAVCRRHQRFGLVLMAPDARTRAALAERYPSAIVVAAPTVAIGPAASRLIKRLKIKCFVAVDALAELGPALLARLRRRGVPVVAVETVAEIPASDIEAHRGPAGRTTGIEHYIVGGSTAMERLRSADVDERQISVIGGLDDPNGVAADAVHRLVEILTPFLARHAALARSREKPIRHFVASLLLRVLSPSRIRRLENVAELRRALGAPRRILCLGNGPSSEDPVLTSMSYDRLFRVNHRWVERGFLARPDLVFTGSKKTLLAVPNTIFALSSIEIETMLLRKWLPYSLFRRLTYFTPERAGILPVSAEATSQPTNGAIMLATAVALEPEALIVAGIDLFRDPKGAYPGDATTANAYAPSHDRDNELRMVIDILSGYRGELTLVGGVLSAHWEEHRRCRAAIDA